MNNLIKSNGNIKLGHSMGTISKLMGNDIYEVNGIKVAGTCGKHCEVCKKECYVKKSYRYPSVVLGHARTTIAFREDLAKAFDSMDVQLSRKRKPFAQVRINQSGEIETTAELLGYVELATKHPETDFYLYTKNFEAVRETIATATLPNNLTILISVWHEYGLAEFKEFEDLPNIKAFVYMDGFQYDLEIGTTCKAYGKDGKLDHNITCDKCRKCFDRRNNHKVIGCNEH